MKHIIKQSSLGKSSFTLLETLLSITLLSIVISGFTYSTYYDTNQTQIYTKLNDLENNFNTNNYKDFSKSSKLLKVTINNKEKKDLLVKVYKYEDENIKVIKYEK